MKRPLLLVFLGSLTFLPHARARAEILRIQEDLGSTRAFPNPWLANRDTAFPLTFDRLPASAISTVNIFTIAGEHVRTISGTQSVQWDLRNGSGERVASGIYIYLLT